MKVYSREEMETLVQRDLRHIWHPCSQMKDYEDFPPLAVVGAQGAYLHLADGRQLIDANSSWWCKSLGHGHPRLRQALCAQAQELEHVLLANLTHAPIVQLSEQLAGLSRTLTRAFYASDGSCAVEIALKMSLHARQLQGQAQRQRFLALANSYHGETSLALSVSDLALYRAAYRPLLVPVNFLQHIPYVHGKTDPVWQDCSAYWPMIERQLNEEAAHLTAIIVEPMVQAAGGMRIYSQDFLRRLRVWTQQHEVHLIADEIATGLGRTGLPLACQHAGVEPDFLCLGKSLTAGWLPLSAVLTSDAIYQLFYDDYEPGKAFLHSHTYAGNALAARVASECLAVMNEENIYAKAQALEPQLTAALQEVAENTGRLTNIRALGAITAADLQAPTDVPRAGYQVYRHAVALGALLRPLGNTIYWLPPLNISEEVIQQLKTITQQAVLQAARGW